MRADIRSDLSCAMRRPMTVVIGVSGYNLANHVTDKYTRVNLRPGVKEECAVCEPLWERRGIHILSPVPVQELPDVVSVDASVIDPNGEVVVVQAFLGELLPAAIRGIE